MDKKDNKNIQEDSVKHVAGSEKQEAVSDKQVAASDKNAEAAAEVKKVVSKKKNKRSVPIGQVHIQATFNNTIVSFTDNNGNVLSASSAGACGFRGSKKGTAYAAQIAVDKAAEIAKSQFGLAKVAVYIKGVGLGRDSAIRSILNHNMVIDSITDVTSVAHGGVRPKKARRV